MSSDNEESNQEKKEKRVVSILICGLLVLYCRFDCGTALAFTQSSVSTNALLDAVDSGHFEHVLTHLPDRSTKHLTRSVISAQKALKIGKHC